MAERAEQTEKKVERVVDPDVGPPSDTQVGLERKGLTTETWSLQYPPGWSDSGIRPDEWCVPGREGKLAGGEWVRYRITTRDAGTRTYRVHNQETKFGTRDCIIRGLLTDIKNDHENILEVAWQIIGEIESISGNGDDLRYGDLKDLLVYYVMGLG